MKKREEQPSSSSYPENEDLYPENEDLPLDVDSVMRSLGLTSRPTADPSVRVGPDAILISTALLAVAGELRKMRWDLTNVGATLDDIDRGIDNLVSATEGS